MKAIKIIGGEAKGPAQHVLCSSLTIIRHDSQRIEDKYEVVIVGEQVEPIRS